MNTNELLSQLRKFVLIKSGLRNIDPGHCKAISEYVFKETKNYVSETTVKRFFGFAQVIHKFSLFTLNSLSQYVGYADWESFCKDKEREVYSVDNIWQDLKFKCHVITDVSLIAKKNNSGVPFDATANRDFLYADFEYFLKNNYQFTTVSSQPGHGKSILLAHLTEHFFYAENAPYKKDIVLLINSGSLSNIVKNGLSLKDWFYKEFKFNSVNELINYFKKNPQKREGRFILIVDGIDEYLMVNNYFKVFIDFLKSIQESNFIKIVLSLRTNTWVNTKPLIAGSAFLEKVWYKGLFFDEENQTNIPYLNREEILYTLSCIEGREIEEANLHHSLINLFKIPFWLQVYYKLKRANNIPELNNQLLSYELIYYFLEQKIFLSKCSTEKIFILKKICTSVSLGSKGLRVVKSKVLNYIDCYPKAFQELVNDGILIEEKRLSTSVPTEIIRFLSDDIYTYFLFIRLTEKINYKPSKVFFKEILDAFADKLTIREHILNWSIRFCINRNEIEALKNIFQLPFTNQEKNNAFDFIGKAAVFELKKNNSNFNSQTLNHHLIDILVNGRLMNKEYKETVKNISKCVFKEDIQIMLHVMECTINIMDIDKAALRDSMQLLKRNYKLLNELFPINPYDLILFFYYNLNNKAGEGKTLNEKISKLCKLIHKSAPLQNKELSSAEMLSYRLVLVILFMQKNFEGCERFIMAILNKYPNIFCLRSSIFSSYLLILLSQVYLKLNQYKKAQRIIGFLEKAINEEQIYYTIYTKTAYIVLKANFYNYTGHYDFALKEINKGIEEAGKYNLHTFEISLRLIKIDVLKHTEEAENVSEEIKELLIFLAKNKLTLPDFSNLNHSNFDQTFNILKSYKSHI